MQDLPHSFGVQYIRRAGANVEESEKFLCPVCVFYVPDTAVETKRGRCISTAHKGHAKVMRRLYFVPLYPSMILSIVVTLNHSYTYRF